MSKTKLEIIKRSGRVTIERTFGGVFYLSIRSHIDNKTITLPINYNDMLQVVEFVNNIGRISGE